jgi:hypothetical protein
MSTSYTTWGRVHGGCDHFHDLESARRCLARYYAWTIVNTDRPASDRHIRIFEGQLSSEGIPGRRYDPSQESHS